MNLNQELNKKTAIDKIALSTVSTPLETKWEAGTRITVNSTGKNYILTAANTPGDTIATLITAGKIAGITMDIPIDNLGTVSANGTVVEEGNGIFHKTTITMAADFGAIAGGANLAVGLLAYTLPAGIIRVHTPFLNGIALQQTEGNVTADTPDVGLGTTIASGAVAVLGGTAAFENVLTGQTFTNCDGTAERLGVPTPLATAIIDAAADHTVYLNIADGWAASGEAALGVTGDIILIWEFLS